jgi:hypothetical protein
VKRLLQTVLLICIVQISGRFVSAQVLGGPQVPVAKATIEGSVVRLPGGEPLARAQITIARNSPPAPAAGQPANQAAGQRGANPQAATPANAGAAPGATASIAPVITDDQGKFEIKDLEPGTYRLYAARNGYTRMEYGQKLMYRPGTVLNITAGQSMKDVVFRLTPAGTITGRIVDDQGERTPERRTRDVEFHWNIRSHRTGSTGASPVGASRSL